MRLDAQKRLSKAKQSINNMRGGHVTDVEIFDKKISQVTVVLMSGVKTEDDTEQRPAEKTLKRVPEGGTGNCNSGEVRAQVRLPKPERLWVSVYSGVNGKPLLQLAETTLCNRFPFPWHCMRK